MIRPEDALRAAAETLTRTVDWTTDAIGDCEHEHEHEIDALLAIRDSIRELAAQFLPGDRYTNGRLVKSTKEIQDGLYTVRVWHPDPAQDVANSWRGHLPSGDPDTPSPGIYQVSCDPNTQEIHVSVIRTVNDDDETAGGEA